MNKLQSNNVRDNAGISAEVELQVPFYDVDMMRVAWHGHYLKYCERARCALLDKLRYNYAEMEASGYMWPIVDLRLKYIKPARFNQLIRVRATLTEYENRLRMEYAITDAATGARLTTGYSLQVAVAIANGEMSYVSPPILLEKVQVCRAADAAAQ
jgi:acyl-CoA thioester hydrolase